MEILTQESQHLPGAELSEAEVALSGMQQLFSIEDLTGQDQLPFTD